MPEPCEASSSTRNERNFRQKTKESHSHQFHFNSIWSIWYCIVTTIFTLYLGYSGVKRFLVYTSLPWKHGKEPYVELNAFVGLVGAAVVVLPFFMVVSILKVGNLANDGAKLGSSLSACSRTSQTILNPTPGLIRNLWLHGVPTGPFLHLIAAFCFLLARILMDASLVKGGFLSLDNVWKTDMDPIIFHNERHFLPRNSSKMEHMNSFPTESSVLTVEASENLRLPRAAQVQWSSEPKPNPFAKPSQSETRSFLPAAELNPSTPLPEVGFFDKKLHQNTVGKSYWKPFSAEIVYYMFALLVFAVRYPSVFWNTSKTFSFIFSLQLIVNSAQTLLTLSSFSILYKIQMNDPSKTLFQTKEFLVGPYVALALMVVTMITITASSTCLYVYGYHKFTKFMNRSKQRYHISYEETPFIVQPYTSQILSLITLLLLGLAYGPYLWDLTTVYKGSMDTVVLASIVGTIAYIFLWIILWLFLSLKSSWVFKLRVTVARAFVSSARSIKLVNDIELTDSANIEEEKTLLVVNSGKAYAIQDSSPQSAIMNVIQNTTEEQSKKGDNVYWLRSSGKRKKSSKGGQTKVTFSESVDQDSLARKLRHRQALQERGYRLEDDEEGGDYAFLKGSSSQSDDSGGTSPYSPDDENPRYVDRRQILAYREAHARAQDMSPPSPILVAPDYEENENTTMSPAGLPSRQKMFLESHGAATPRSIRSNDSGMMPENQSQRSDSISSSVSTNTPHENSEESGIHSGSNENYRLRSNSVDDLSQLPPDARRQPVHPNFPHVQRPPQMSISGIYGYCKSNPPVGHYKVMYPSNETTMAIKRQRNMTHEIKPPLDPIYGVRKLTSFTDSVKQHNENKIGYISPQSTSSGYQSTNNSAANSPIPAVPLPPINEQSYSCSGPYNGRDLHQESHITPVHGSSHSDFADRDGGVFQFSNPPQLPLPPIPHSFSSNPGIGNFRNDLYGRSQASQSFSGAPKPLFSQLNRSTSLRLPHHSGPKQYTNTLPHVLPKDSFYNTNV